MDILGCIWRVFFFCLFQLVNSASDLEDPLPPKTQGTNSCNYLDESFLWFHVKLTPWKSSLALSLVKCFIMKYAKKICMENHYTLTCFIIRITGELLQTATLKGLVIIYHLSGGGGGCRGEGLCWWRTDGVTITWNSSVQFCTFLRSPPFRCHFQFTDIQFSIVFCRHSLSGKTDSPLSPTEKPCDPPKFSTNQAINNDKSLS